MFQKKLKSYEVFTPGSFPAHTYVEREDGSLEADLRSALRTKGLIVSLSGPSKSGKTVLVERVVGRDLLIPISAATITTEGEMWHHILDWMGAPSETGSTRQNSTSGSLNVGGKAEKGIIVAKGEVHGDVGVGHTRAKGRSEVHARGGMSQVIKEIADSDFVVLLDDFHYMDRKLQSAVAKQIKEAARQGVRFILASVPHRSEDAVRSLPDLRGRVVELDLDFWSSNELAAIAEFGFKALSVEISTAMADEFVREAAGSPQLMQSICLNACDVLGVDEGTAGDTPKLDRRQLDVVFRKTSRAAQFRALVDVLDEGPRVRGQDRKTYQFIDGTNGDVYRTVLKSIAADPPSLSFTYDELRERAAGLCVGDVPSGSSMVGSCQQMASLAHDRFATERALDWDDAKQVLEIVDPLLLFYLRWSERLAEPER